MVLGILDFVETAIVSGRAGHAAVFELLSLLVSFELPDSPRSGRLKNCPAEFLWLRAALDQILFIDSW